MFHPNSVPEVSFQSSLYTGVDGELRWESKSCVNIIDMMLKFRWRYRRIYIESAELVLNIEIVIRAKRFILNMQLNSSTHLPRRVLSLPHKYNRRWIKPPLMQYVSFSYPSTQIKPLFHSHTTRRSLPPPPIQPFFHSHTTRRSLPPPKIQPLFHSHTTRRSLPPPQIQPSLYSLTPSYLVASVWYKQWKWGVGSCKRHSYLLRGKLFTLSL